MPGSPPVTSDQITSQRGHLQLLTAGVQDARVQCYFPEYAGIVEGRAKDSRGGDSDPETTRLHRVRTDGRARSCDGRNAQRFCLHRATRAAMTKSPEGILSRLDRPATSQSGKSLRGPRDLISLAGDLRSYAMTINRLADWLDPNSDETWKLEFGRRNRGSRPANDHQMQEDAYRLARVQQLQKEGMKHKQAIGAVAKERRCSDAAVKASIGRIKKRFGPT